MTPTKLEKLDKYRIRTYTVHEFDLESHDINFLSCEFFKYQVLEVSIPEVKIDEDTIITRIVRLVDINFNYCIGVLVECIDKRGQIKNSKLLYIRENDVIVMKHIVKRLSIYLSPYVNPKELIFRINKLYNKLQQI